MKSFRENMNRRGRRKSTRPGLRLGVRIQPPMLAEIDIWIASQPDPKAEPPRGNPQARRGGAQTLEANRAEQRKRSGIRAETGGRFWGAKFRFSDHEMERSEPRLRVCQIERGGRICGKWMAVA